MPKRPADSDASEDEAGEGASGVVLQQAKRSKTKGNSLTSGDASKQNDGGSTSSIKPLKDDNGDEYWDLNDKGTRRVTVSEFKGMKLIGVREYYESGGKMLPGKKGISMTIEQFSSLIERLPDIEKALAKKGQQIPRPAYGGAGLAAESDMADGPPETSTQKASKATKQNFEETSSDEEEE